MSYLTRGLPVMRAAAQRAAPRAPVAVTRRNMGGHAPVEYEGVDKIVRDKLPEDWQVVLAILGGYFMLYPISKIFSGGKKEAPAPAATGGGGNIPSIADDSFEAWSKIPGNMAKWEAEVAKMKQRPSASSHGHLAQRAWFGTGVRVDGGWSVRPVDAGRQWRGFDGTGWRAGRVGPGRHENNRTKVSERTNKTTNESAARPLACVRGQGGSFCVETRQTNGGGRLPGVQQNQDGKQGGASGRRPLSCVRRGGGGAAARWRRMRREPRASRVLVGMWGGKPGRCGRWGVDARVRCERDASAAPAVAAGEARPRGGRACAVLAPGWCVR
eukprot:CAMPEP_0182531784 /NCGR_PEP_ID=MMETSP1323-20130603/10068_1 /TAXON_ID=236787 /ORGANISM="Florenciella parvula, Strain RCC1693" /LENGTH=326 /DNA_ID=CAMNT_0024741415 /DNA_START=30 /DNA_END=1011 /DNA_ORIENTATION=-